MTDPQTYEVYAIRYATSPWRRRSQCFIHNDPHDGPCPMDFFVWLALGARGPVLIDVGTKEANARARGHDFLICPADGLRLVGVEPRDIRDIVLTHLHWDHAGNVDLFPNARLHLQAEEMSFATGPLMRRKLLRRPFEADDVCSVVRRVYDDMVVYHEGDGEIAPGIEVRRVGGHSAGMQIVRIHTQRGWLVLASDASHYYANLTEENPFPVLVNIVDSLRGFDAIRRWAPGPDHVIPGHDPLVMDRYQAPSSALLGQVVRLDVAPREISHLSRAV
jgi:glyoxylase-like metal-dependent hydrolase (beta-lactamase superfamily II)